ncbi:MAG: energy transducer TonB [Acidobacteriia bacterium]|nr:energy transducer TonB [Terriglobia bacterium]
MRKSFIVFAFFLTLLAARPAAASGDSLESTLNQKYKKQSYSLRHAVISDSQHFDSSGKLLGDSLEGPWTVYGRLSINKIKLKPGKLIIEGQRIGYLFDKRQRKLTPYKLDESTKLEIVLDQPLPSAEEADKLLGRIFAFSKEDFLASVSSLWRPYLESQVEVYSDDGRNLQFKEHPDQKKRLLKAPAQPKDVQQQEKAQGGIYRVGNGVKAPVFIFTPDPDYNDIARKAKLQATNVFDMVIDESGKVAGLQLVQPAGLGLDENSVIKLRTWNFHPAMRDDRPVKVLVTVEVSFNLY